MGDYQLSLTDGGKATSIVSSLIGKSAGQVKVRLGTIGVSGVFSPLASSSDNFSPELFSDIALSPTGKLYGIGHAIELSLMDYLAGLAARRQSIFHQ